MSDGDDPLAAAGARVAAKHRLANNPDVLSRLAMNATAMAELEADRVALLVEGGATGVALSAIAEACGTDEPTVVRWLRKLDG